MPAGLLRSICRHRPVQRREEALFEILWDEIRKLFRFANVGRKITIHLKLFPLVVTPERTQGDVMRNYFACELEMGGKYHCSVLTAFTENTLSDLGVNAPLNN